MPLNVSIITPAYNTSETIKDTLNSILLQTHPHWEAIVVDDGSTDGTAEIVAEFVRQDSRIRLIQQPHGGQAIARNTALAVARFDWLLFLDSDDWIAPTHLSKLTTEVLSNSNLDVVYCRSARVAADGTMIPESYVPPSADLFPILAYRAAFAVHACIVRKSIVDAVGKFDVSRKRSFDWDLWQRVARTGARFGAVPEVLAYYRMRSNSATIDAYEMFRSGLQIIRQGHTADTRVPKPHPLHANGEPPKLIPNQVFYLLSWCAGLLLGTGSDPKPLIDLAKEYRFSELYPEAVAQCILDSVPLPNCQPPAKWEEFAKDVLPRIDEFFVQLENQSSAVGLARDASLKLRQMILARSPSWSPVVRDYETQIERQEERIEKLEEVNVELIKKMEERQQLIEKYKELNLQLTDKCNECDQLIENYKERDRILRNFEKQFWFRLGLRLELLNLPSKHSHEKRLIDHLESLTGRFSLLIAVIAIAVSTLHAILYRVEWGASDLGAIGICLAGMNLITAIFLLIKPRIRFLAATVISFCAQLGFFIFTL